MTEPMPHKSKMQQTSDPAASGPAKPQPTVAQSVMPLKRIMAGLITIAVAFIVAAVMLPKSANAKDAIGLNAKQTQTVKNLQAYLNDIATLKSRFIQFTSQGSFAQGDFLMERPGRMRISYDAPNPILIVSDGTWVMYKDKELDQISYMLLSALPASMFIGETVDFFDEGLLITDFTDQAGVVRITLQRSNDPLEGSLSLIFQAAPLALKKWTVVDAQGINTTVSLLGPEFGVLFDQNLFKIENNRPKKSNDN